MENNVFLLVVAIAVAVGLGIYLLRMLLALLGLVSSSGKITKDSPHNRTLALGHIFAIAGYALIAYAQLLFTGTKYQIPMDVAGGVCLVIGWVSMIVIERRIDKHAKVAS